MRRGFGLFSWTLLVSAFLLSAQQAPVVGDLEDMLRQARQEILDFKKAGGKNNDAAHPAQKWARTLWTWRDTVAGTQDAAKATTEALRMLVYADRFTEAQDLADRVPPDDPAWQGLARVLLDSASVQKDYKYFFAKTQAVLSAAPDAVTRAAVQLSLGRAWRQQRDDKKAESAFRSAIELAAESPAGKQAQSQLYELSHLSVGQPAPSFSANALGGRRLSPADYRGKALVLVFWGTY